MYPLQQEFTWLTSRTLRTTLIALGGAVGLVLLVACVNVASLLLSRSASRARELAIRAAIGAGRERLMRQLLTEGFLLATVGSAVGVLMAYTTIRYVAYARPIELPPGVELRIHGTTLIFTAVLSMATTLAFGLVPAWRGSLARPDERLKAGGRGSIGHGSTHRFLRGLVFAQVALSVALLAAAGLLIDSVVRLGAESIGFDPNHLLSSHITLPKERYSEESRQRQLYRTLEDRISQLPGVTGAALTSGFIVGGAPVQEVEISGRASSAQRRAMQFAVSNHTFGVFRIPVVRGRSFTESDGSDSAPVAIVNGAFASQYLGNAPPLGQRIRIGDADGQNPWLTIVGVVGNVKGAALYNEMGWTEPATVFRPLTQYSSRSLSLVIRTAGRLDGIGRLVQRQIVDVDSEIPINEPILVSAWVAQRFTYPRFRALVFGAFAVLALLLAAVGLYGVLSQFVAARKQEFALRMALGASRGHIFRLVSAYGGVPLVAGFAVGIAASMVAARAVANLLYGVHPGDPLIVGVTAVALFVVAGFALVLPARRAVNVEPVAALRDE